MSYPNADTASLANYYIASKQVETERAEYIAELKVMIVLLLDAPGISPDLVARARALLEDDGGAE